MRRSGTRKALTSRPPADSSATGVRLLQILESQFDVVRVQGRQQLVQFALHDVVQAVQREVHAVIAQTVLREVVGAYPLAAVARAGE